jgi:rare lipoprotein A (peptidoglycan hydrolase)
MSGPAGRRAHTARAPEDDDLSTRTLRIPRSRLAFALAATVAAVPVLIMDNLPASARPDRRVDLAVATATADSLPSETTEVTDPASPATTAPTTSTTAAEPVAEERSTTTSPEPSSTSSAPSTTAAPTTTTMPPPRETGGATWYEQPSSYGPGGCAHRTLPFGTVVTVTSTGNGRSTNCVVNDRGPFGDGRVIDLDDDVYIQLAPLASGIIAVELSW